MARGNQREKAREKNLKEQGQQVCISHASSASLLSGLTGCFASSQKKKNTMSGTEFARTKEDQAAIMRQKQEAGMCLRFIAFHVVRLV